MIDVLNSENVNYSEIGQVIANFLKKMMRVVVMMKNKQVKEEDGFYMEQINFHVSVNTATKAVIGKVFYKQNCNLFLIIKSFKLRLMKLFFSKEKYYK